MCDSAIYIFPMDNCRGAGSRTEWLICMLQIIHKNIGLIIMCLLEVASKVCLTWHQSLAYSMKCYGDDRDIWWHFDGFFYRSSPWPSSCWMEQCQTWRMDSFSRYEHFWWQLVFVFEEKLVPILKQESVINVIFETEYVVYILSGHLIGYLLWWQAA